MFKKILVPLDGSKLSEAVLPDVRELAKAMGSEVVLLRVVPVGVNTSLAGFLTMPVMPAPPPPEEDVHAQAEGYLQRVAFDLLPDQNVTLSVVGGPTADNILELATQMDADLIAMTTHGRSGVGRMVMGSVADEIVRRSHLPVLLIRPT